MENTEETKHTEAQPEQEEMKLSGDDITGFFRRLFKAGNSRSVVWRDDDNKKVFSINLIIIILMCFIIPMVALLAILFLILLNHSLTIEKKVR